MTNQSWERELIGKNKHSVYTWCFDCCTYGCNMPNNYECGNCGSKNTVKYYDAETISHLLKERDAEILGWIEGMEVSPKLTNTYWWTRGDEITKADVYREAVTDLKSKITAVKESL